MPIVSFFRSAARAWRPFFAAVLAASATAFAQSPSAADGFDPNVDGNVYALAAQADGRLILGGQFATLHPSVSIGAGRNNLARVMPDGSADLSFNPNANGAVRTVVLQSNGQMLIGGDFTTIGGVTRNHLARLNADGSLDTAFNPNANGNVNAILVLPDGRLVIGGAFTSVGGVTRNRCARLSNAGVVDPAFDPNFNNIVFALAVHGGGKIIVGGAFTSLQPAGASAATPRGRLARLNADGTPDSEFDGGANSSVYAIAVQRDGHILFGGAFTSVQPIFTPAAVARGHFARLQADGQFDTTFVASAGGDVNAIIVLADGSILIGGTFTTAWGAGSAPAGRGDLARFSADGSLDANFIPTANQTVSALAALPDGRLAIGGYFTRIATRTAPIGVIRNRLARLNNDGSLDATFALEDGGRPLVSLVQSDGKILIGGTFTQVGGVTRDYLARLNTDGSLDTTFNPAPNGRVTGLALQGNQILVSGFFTTMNNGAYSISYLARLNADGSVDKSFNPTPGSSIEMMLVQSDGKILIGGEFTSLTPTTTVTSNSTGTAGITTTSNKDGSITTVTITVANGVTTTVTATQFARSHFARLGSDGSVDVSFNPAPNSTVLALAIQSDGKILLGGSFTTLQPNDATVATSRIYLARIQADGTLDTDYHPTPNGAVSAIVLQSDGKAVVGGGFTAFPPATTSSTTVITRNRLARVNTDGSIDATFDPNANGLVETLTLQTDGKILAGGNFTTLQPNGATNWTSRKYAARLNTDGTFDPNFDLDLDERSGNNVTSLRVQSDGKILVCGGFLSFQAVGDTTRTTRSHFIRVNSPASGKITLDTAFNPAAAGAPAGTINALAVQTDGRIVVAGAFADLGGATTANIARFNPEGSVDTTFSRATGADGAINAVALRLNTAGLTPQLPGFAWLDANGGLRSAFKPGSSAEISGFVSCYAFQTDGSLLLGGSFSNLTGATSNNLIRFKADGTLDTDFRPNPNGPVDAIWIQKDGRILIAGGFTTLEPNGAETATTRNRIARLNPDGTLDTVFDPNANGRVSIIQEDANGLILLAGQFTTLQPNSVTTTNTTTATTKSSDKEGTTTVNNADGSTTTTTITLDTTAKTTTTTVTTVTNATATARNYVARVKTDGNLDTAFNPSPGGQVNALAVQADGKILLGGYFTTVAPTTTTVVTNTPNAGSSTNTKTNADGSTTTTTISTVSGTTTTVVVTSYSRNFFARVNATDGSLDTAFNPNPNANVNALVFQPDGQLLVGGAFTSIAGATRYNLARLKADATVDTGFDPNANAAVNMIAVQPDGKILISGLFTTLAPNGGPAANRGGFARLTSAGALDSFDPNPNGSVFVAAGRSDGSVLLAGTFTSLLPGGVMYVGGTFNNLGGVPVHALVALNADGSANSGFAPNPNGDVNALLVQPDGKLVVGGTFTSISGAARSRLARFNADGSLDTAFNSTNSTVSGNVTALAIQPDGRLIVGTSTGGLTRLLANGQSDTFAATTTTGGALPPIRNIFVLPDGKILVLAGGSVSRRNSDGSFDLTFTDLAPIVTGPSTLALQSDGRLIKNAVRLNANGSVDVTFAPAPDNTVTALALQADGRPFIGGSFKTVGGLSRVALARLGLSGTAMQSLAIAGGSGASRSLLWSRDGISGELSSATFEISSDARTWTPLTVTVARPTNGRGWQTGLVTVPLDAPFYIRARGLVASGTGTSGIVEYVQQFNLASSATFAGTASPSLTTSAVVDAKTGQPLYVQTSSAGSGDFTALDFAGVSVGGVTQVPTTSVPGTNVPGADGRLVNLSVRARVTTATPLITGFAISGTTARSVLIRGVGPSLGAFGVTTPLATPRLRLYDSSGKQLLENNGWAATPQGVADVGAAIVRTGAFPFVANAGTDTALVTTLAPGTYSVQVLDAGGTGGTALAEIYDADTTTTSKLVNISSRTNVTSADGAFITGFVITGGTKNLLVRGLGPALTQFGVSSPLADPAVGVYDSAGRLLSSNDNWSNTTADGAMSINTAVLAATATQVGAFPLTVGSADSALTLALAPGAYTVQVRGAATDATGTAVLEIYELP